MSEYLPYSEQHSIQEAKVALHFQHEFGQQDVERSRDAVAAELKDLLPRSAEIRGSSVAFNLTDPSAPTPMPPVPDHLVGFEFTKIRGDSRPARSLRLVNNSLEVSISDYERWEITLNDTIGYIRTTLALLPLDANPIMAADLQFIDRFAFNGTLDDVDASLLFQQGGDYIAKRCFTSGPLWHCHTGWFDMHPNGRILNHLNIGSAFVDSSPTVTIDHNAVFQLNSPRQSIDALLQPIEENIGLRDILNWLHGRNKQILSELLTQEMQDKIGLQK